MPKAILAPLLVLNGMFAVLLITVGPAYGWTVMVIVGAVVSAANLYAVYTARRIR